MKIKIKLGDVEKEINISLKGKDQKDFISQSKKLSKLATDDESDPNEVIEEAEKFMFDYIEGLIIERGNLTKEDLDEMDLEEKNKLIGTILNQLTPAGAKNFFLTN